MEGVGARFGRSSTRYGAGPSQTVFSGPVRKWKKRWVLIPPPPTSNNNKHKHNHKNPNSHSNNNNNNSSNSSRLSLFKWTKTSSSSVDDITLPDPDEENDNSPPRRKFRYIPIATLEEQKIETEENDVADNLGDKLVPSETSFGTTKKLKKADSEEKPDINDEPMYEIQGRGGKVARHDLNEGTFDLSLG